MGAEEIELVRKTFESALAAGGDDAAALLADLGWWELHAADPMVATGQLFEAQGRLRRVTSALDVIVAHTCGVTLDPTTAVVHQPLDRWTSPPGRADADGTVRFDGLVVAGLERAEQLLVPFSTEDGIGIVAVEIARVDARPRRGLDPKLRLVAVSGVAEGRSRSMGSSPAGGWDTVAAAARRALAHELCGLAGAMLDRTVAHVSDRHQFGRPIAAFQTVRHRLTEVYVALACARSVLEASWATGDPRLGAAAKALAGRAGLLAARHCLQVSGAIGFTEEYDLPDDIRRVHLLDAFYGGAEALTADIGRGLLDERSVPRLHPLPT